MWELLNEMRLLLGFHTLKKWSDTQHSLSKEHRVPSHGPRVDDSMFLLQDLYIGQEPWNGPGWALLDTQDSSRAGEESHGFPRWAGVTHSQARGPLDTGIHGRRTRNLTSACLLKKDRSPLFSSLMEEGPARTEVGAQVGQVCQA